MFTNLNIETVLLVDIHEYVQNAKKHEEKQVQQIAQSISEFGFTNPILIDKDGEIIAGHGRYAAAKLLGLETVPVIRLDYLTEAQKRAFRLADNKISENGGGWNEDLLKLELKELEIMADFDIQLTGFDTISVDVLLDDTKKAEKDNVSEKANVAPFIADDEIVTKVGDVWSIGKHRLICGSSIEEATFEWLMDGKQADLVVSDPPFNISSRFIGSSGKIKHDDFQMAAGEMTSAEFTEFLTKNFGLCAKYSTASALAYEFMDWRHIPEMMSAGQSCFGRLVNLCVWAKPNGGMGDRFIAANMSCVLFGVARIKNI